MKYLKSKWAAGKEFCLRHKYARRTQWELHKQLCINKELVDEVGILTNNLHEIHTLLQQKYPVDIQQTVSQFIGLSLFRKEQLMKSLKQSAEMINLRESDKRRIISEA